MKTNSLPEQYPPLRVLLVGATGVFGKRLAIQLVEEPGTKIILAARTREPLEALNQQLGNRCKTLEFNRNQNDPDCLKKLHCDVVIDAAGPFQQSQTVLIEAAITAGCHYIDLADGREFVTSIRQFHQQAIDNNVAVISGASSTPALSHAVIDQLTKNWRDITSIKVAITPGNRAPRGLSVMQAILSYVGKPVRVFRDGGWQNIPGWGLTHRQLFPELGTRWLSVCETPDQDLLVDRYQPSDSAEFYAGLELGILHRGLVWLSYLVRWKIIPSLRPYAKTMHHIANWFEHWGSDRGGMLVIVKGTSQQRSKVSAQWSLMAESGDGPYVPTLAALALVRKIRDQQLAFRGAAPCVGILTLDDFNERFKHFDIRTQSAALKT